MVGRMQHSISISKIKLYGDIKLVWNRSELVTETTPQYLQTMAQTVALSNHSFSFYQLLKLQSWHIIWIITDVQANTASLACGRKHGNLGQMVGNIPPVPKLSNTGRSLISGLSNLPYILVAQASSIVMMNWNKEGGNILFADNFITMRYRYQYGFGVEVGKDYQMIQNADAFAFFDYTIVRWWWYPVSNGKGCEASMCVRLPDYIQ